MLNCGCWECCFKHLSQALILCLEERKGGSAKELSRARLVGHLAEAEDECPSAEIAKMIREARTNDITLLPELISTIERERDEDAK